MVWENVPGAFSSNKGKDFQAVLTEIVRIVEPEAPDVPLPEKGWPHSGCLYDELGKWSVAWRVHDAQFWGVPQRRKRISLVADFGGLSAPEILFEREGLSGDSEPCGEAGQETAGAAGEGVEGAGCYGLDHVMLSGGTTYQGRGYYDNVSGCLKTQPHGVCETISSQERGGKPGGGKGILIQHEHVGALSTTTMLIASVYGVSSFGAYKEGTTSLRAQGGDNGGGSENIAVQNAIVRRLTPLECERLQGYPDGWTDIGEWVDSKGKKHKDADSPRYKALGNSIALPFWQWMFGRIAEQYPAEKRDKLTLGSLFDGIGGFPLCWERCNGKGTAIWASEIEEFPIAVTKFHFPEDDE